MAYMLCTDVEDGELAHSCVHGPPPHEVKVCVFAKHNREHWPAILARVGPKPTERKG